MIGTFQHDAVEIGYSQSGHGPPLLIAPVPWGVDGHRWTTLDTLADNFTLIRLDPRGTGRSGSVREKSEYGIPTLVADIEALRLHLGIDRWHVMGQSAGGWTALEYTLAFPLSVDKLIVVCSAPTGKFHKGTFRDPSHPLFPEFDRISKEVRTLPAEERVKAFNRAVYQFDIQTENGKKIIDAVFADAEFNSQRNQYFAMTELNRYDVTGRLNEITVPSLIIGGTHDVHVSPEWSSVLAEKIPSATLTMMERSGHFPWLDEPERFFSDVRKFLKHGT